MIVGVSPPPLDTVTLIASLPDRLPVSVTLAAIVWVPSLSDVLIEAPLPRSPSRFEVQLRLDDRSPSSTSSAVPVNAMTSLGRELDPGLKAS